MSTTNRVNSINPKYIFHKTEVPQFLIDRRSLNSDYFDTNSSLFITLILTPCNKELVDYVLQGQILSSSKRKFDFKEFWY